MCPHCRHPEDDHSAGGGCLTCSKQGRECKPAEVRFVTIRIGAGSGDLTPVTMPTATTAGRAAMRAAEALGLDPEARNWFLYDPVARVPLVEGEVMAAFDNRVLILAWTEERR